MTPLDARLDALLAHLLPLAAQCPTSPEYWLDLGDTETEDSYCGACARMMLAGLLMVDPAGDWALCGGYCQEKDLLEHCTLCHVLLDGSLTCYGLEEETTYFLHNLDALLPLDPETAHMLVMVVESSRTVHAPPPDGLLALLARLETLTLVEQPV